MKDIRHKIFRTLFALGLLIFSITSCEVGLGAAVDTVPPELVIESPESASIIRGSFAIKGSWTDDRGVDSVLCTLTNTENEEKKYVVHGQVTTSKTGEGSWNIIIEKDSIADGPYEAAVSIFDKAGHESKAVRQLVIDNTPPVIILKRPSSRKGEENSENIDGYGQVFSIKGLAADDSGVGLIEVNIYSDEALTQQVGKTISINNVPNTISLDVAEFVEGEENVYSAIYGSTDRSIGEQKRWCRVTAYDGSQAYPVDGSEQTEEDKKGNASLSYYLYEDISSTVLSQYKITDLYAMRNGSYNSGTNARSAMNDTLDTLSESEISAGVFTLNPSNNPFYTVSGYQQLKLDGTDFDDSMIFKNGNSLVISVKPGLDSYEIVPESLKVFLQQCDKYGTGSGNLIPLEITKTKSGTTYIITAPVAKGKGISIGKRYRLILEGQDEKGNKVTSKGNGYGFYLDSNAVKPSIKVEEPQSTATVTCRESTDSITISGKVYFPSESCDGGSVIIKDATGNLEWLVATYMDQKDDAGNITGIQQTDVEHDWSIQLNLKKDNAAAKDTAGHLYLPDGNHSLNIYAITGTDFDNAENIVSVERNIRVDTLKPETPILTKVSDLTYSATSWYKSQNLKVELGVADKTRSGYASGLFKTEYTVGTTNIWTTLSSASYGYINGLSDGDNTVTFRSIDEAGNISETADYIVKVDTVIPVITKASIGDSSWKDFTAGNVLNIKSTDGKKLKLEIEEANTLPQVTVTVAGTNLEGTYSRESESSSKWTWLSNNAANLTENQEILIKVIAKDGAQGEGIAEYKVIVDTEGPDIEITSPDHDVKGEESISQKYTLRAGISDKAGNVNETKYLLTDTLYGDDTAALTDARGNLNGWQTSQGKGSVSVGTETKNIEKGKWYLYVYSIDEAENESLKVRSFWFDSDTPQLGTTNKPEKKYNKKISQAEQKINISGTASDSNGIAKVEYSTDGGSNWTDLNCTAALSVDWSIELSYGENTALEDGNYIFVFRVTDGAERTNSESYNVLIDTLPPEILPSADESWHTELKIDADITVKDVTSLVRLVEYSTDYNEVTQSGDWTPFTYNETTEKATGPVVFETSGIKTIYIKATDDAGNVDIKSVVRKLDADKPKLTAKYTQSGDSPAGNFGGTAYENGTAPMTFWGEYSDAVSGVKEISLWLSEKVNDVETSKELKGQGITIEYSTADLPAAANATMPEFKAWDALSAEEKSSVKAWKALIQGGKLETGTISVQGSDEAGNTVTAQQTTNIEHDITPPTITSSSINIKDNSAVTRAYYAGLEEGSLKYYVNNSAGKTFTITGVSIDANGVAETKLKIGEGDTAHTSYINSGTAASWSFTVTDLNTFSGADISATVTTTDLAGNSTNQKLKFVFDNIPPEANGAVKIDSKDYSSGMWGTNTVLTVNGQLTENTNGSGAAKIYYKRFASKSAAQAATDPTNEGLIVIDAGSSVYNGKITNLAEGDNYLLLIAEDNVGNTKPLDDTDTEPYYLRVDTKAPKIESTSGGTKFANGREGEKVTVTGKCTDEGSGIEGVIVSVTIGNTPHTIPATKTNESDWTGGWKADIPTTGIEDGETYYIEALVTDKAGLSSTLTVATLQGDVNPPKASLSSISPAVSKESNKGYARPKDELIVKGLTEDEHSTSVYTWLKLVPYTIDDEGNIAEDTSASVVKYIGKESPTTARSWEFTIPEKTIPEKKDSVTYAGANLYACTKDLAENTDEKLLYDLIFDLAGPEYVFSIDENETGYTSVAGRVYDAGNWYNSINLIVTGAWKDFAGVTEVYYEIIKTGEGETETEHISKETATTYPSFTLTSSGNGLYTFTSEIRGFGSGENQLKMFAKDALGNISSNPRTDIIKVDTNQPTASEVTEGDFSKVKRTNGKKDQNITLQFYAKDGDGESGIATSILPVIKLGTEALPSDAKVSTEYASEVTDDKGYLATVNLNELNFKNKDNYIPVIAVIKDKAGNSKEVNICTVNVDSEDPTVSLNPPKDADSNQNGIQVNKTFTISGTANDKNLKSRSIVSIQYTETPSVESSWKELYEDYSDSNANITYKEGSTDFTITIDTLSKFTDDTDKFTDGHKYYIRAAVEDEAGNIGWSTAKGITPVEFTVDQDTDRPVISFMDIALPESFDASEPVTLKLASKKLRLTVSDDDGVSSFTTKIAGSPVNADEVKNGTWIYNLSQADGTYDVVFEVTDAGQPDATTYKSKSGTETATEKAPKFTGSSNSITAETIALKLMIDTTSPKLEETQYVWYTDDYPDTPVWETSVPALGGIRKKLALQIKAGDENYIAGVTAKLKQKDNTEKSYAAVGVKNEQNEIIHAKKEDDAEDLKWYSTWIINDIDVSADKLAEGNHNLELTIKDGADNTRTAIILLSVDRKPPELGIDNPEEATTNPNTFTSGSLQAYGLITGATNLQYALSPDGVNAPSGNSVASWTAKDGTSGSCSGASINPTYSDDIEFTAKWAINFDGKLSETAGIHDYLLNDYLIKYGITTKSKLDNAEFTNPVCLYLWLRAQDEVGNETEKKYEIVVNPQGDRPTIDIGYPNSGVTLGKAINIYGTHQDTLGTEIGVKSVWLQLISEAHHVNDEASKISLTNHLEYDELTYEITKFSITADDLNYMKNNGYEVYNMKKYKPSDVSTHELWSGTPSTYTEDGQTKTYSTSDYAALVNINGAAWNITINSNEELDPVKDKENPEDNSTDGKNPVGIRIFAKDGDGKYNTIKAERLVFFDSNMPQITNLQLKQYNGSKVVAVRKYVPDMYISSKNGSWKLTGTAKDNSKITKLTINGEPQTGTGTGTVVFEYALDTGSDDSVGTIEFTIEAEDDSTPVYTGKEDIVIKFDNKKPELITSGADYNIETMIRQSDGFYKFSSKAKEASVTEGTVTTSQSGFAYTAFYFMRGTKLYDILKDKDNSKITENATPETEDYLYEDNIYWYKKTLTSRSVDIATLTLADDTSFTGIRVNSLVKIKGTFYKVTEINENANSFKVDGNPPAAETEAYVAIAGLIDHTVKEEYSSGKIDLDDGDNMLEHVYKSGTTWEWSASVCSKNIADGPVKLVYVVFDAAGNYEDRTVDCIIANNTPRLAGFSLYTDYNNDGDVYSAKDGKYVEYLSSTYSKDSVTGTTGSGENTKNVYDPDAVSTTTYEKKPLKNVITAGSDGAPVMILRGKTVIIPEIVGGNKKVFYDYVINEDTDNEHSGSNDTELFTGSTDYTIKSKEINIQLGDLVNFGNTPCTEFKFTFRDEIEDRADLLANDSFTDNQKKEINAYLSVYLGIAASATEDQKPRVEIDPFYWNSLKENSIKDSNTASSYKDLLGHIELEDDWQASDYYTKLATEPTTGEYDADPKVSGQIVVTGSVHDDNLITNLGITYGTTNGSLISNSSIASFDKGALTSNAVETSYESNGYWLDITEEKFTASGHDVKWTLYLNTEKWGVALDAALTMTATNLGTPSIETEGTDVAYTSIDGTTIYKAISELPTGNSNEPGTDQTTKAYKKAYYRMDIVPYVTDVKTSLSSANTSNHTVYSRTALGHYPVYMTRETGTGTYTCESGIKVYGFNLTNGTNETDANGIISFNHSEADTSNYSVRLSSNTGYYTFDLPANARKGEVTVSVSKGSDVVKTLNNLNNDNSHGDYAVTGTIPLNGDYSNYSNFYNRIPNKVNNNNLTDNLYFDVWDFNSKAAMANNDGKADNVVMKVSPVSGMIGFSFSNGSERFSMGGEVSGTEYSYYKWNRSYDYMSYNTFTYASNGRTFATCAGGDINANNENSIGWDHISLMSDKWGRVGDEPKSNKEGNHILRFDGIGQLGNIKDIEGSANNVRKDRFRSTSIATLRITNANNEPAADASSNNATAIYFAYYDLLNDEIRFRYGKLLDTNGDTTTNPAAFNQFPAHAKATRTNYKETAADCQIMASNYSYKSTDPEASAAYDKSKTLGNAGEYVSVAVTSENVVVLVWYDGNKLKYTYNESPLANLSGPVNVSGSGWQGHTKDLFTGGEYCQIAVGGDDSIHIVAYDPSSANLKYAYLSSYSATPKVCTVDSYLDTGTNLSLDVVAEARNESVTTTNESGESETSIKTVIRYIPHIGYWAAYPEKPRYAYLADTDAFFKAENDNARSGAVSEGFTTIWECGIVPSHSTVAEGKINVGLWKSDTTEEVQVVDEEGNPQTNEDGTPKMETVITQKGVRVSSAYFGTGNKSTADADKGKCYGNETDNAVLAYVVVPNSSTHHIETAQLR